MSNHRTGCSFHQKWLYTDITSNDQPPHLKHAAAATLTYNKRNNAVSNQVFSNRLCISYNTQIKLLDKNRMSTHHTPYIYSKKYYNYHINVSSPSTKYSNATLKRQEIRRERLLKRLLNRENLPQDAKHIPYIFNSVGRKYHFLLSPQQFMFNHIRHIKFNKFLHKPSKLFPLPREWSRHTHRPRDRPKIELEEIFLSEEDNTPWLAPPTLPPIPQERYTIVPPPIEMVPHNSSPGKKQEKLALKRQKYADRRESQRRLEAEAAERRRILEAFHLRVRNLFNYSTPPLISMLNASIGHTRKRNFNVEINLEENRLYMNRSYDDYKASKKYLIASSSLLSDWQKIVHAYMTNSPVTTLGKQQYKKWMDLY
ncbi:hypothetical protein C1645_825471 [Glomus cerebriforme]|uniref:DUF8211 domain-containing protein n=1 Tax=Glomus cerebriforme TaxID=658196 RepID=A0A397SSJ6_9GLOM|nr:hypothetical protein C1645_825471 [Glomus cerebriforme]